MTQEIIEMAEQCGLPEFENNESQASNLIAFAKLIEQRKVNQIADACAKLPFGDTAHSFAVWIKKQV